MDIVKVAAKSRTSLVAGAIAGMFRENGHVEIHAIGSGAVNQAVKGIIAARRYLNEEGVDIFFVPALTDVMIKGEKRRMMELVVKNLATKPATPLALPETSNQEFFLPVSEQAGKIRSPDFQTAILVAPETPKGAILVIDDNEVMREAITDILGLLPEMTVYTAADGQEGLQIFYQKQRQIVLVLLDINMPRMNGPQTYEELYAIAPQVKVIVSSSLSQEEAQARFGKRKLPTFLQKPYDIDTFLHVVKTECALV